MWCKPILIRGWNVKDFKINIQEQWKYTFKVSLSKRHFKWVKSGYNRVIRRKILVGVIIFTGFPVPELAKGMLGLDRTEQQGLFELSRLCLEPTIQKKRT